jgi:hypothetical protein
VCASRRRPKRSLTPASGSTPEVAHDPDFIGGGWPDVKTFREADDQLYEVVEDRVRLRLLREAMRQAQQIGP